jgi:tRNA(Ile2) C34 agmatinyltransferase TiaS
MSRYPEGREPTCPECGTEKIHHRGSKRCRRCADRPGWHGEDDDHIALPRGYESQWRDWQKHIGQAKDRYCGPCRRPVQIGRQ